MREMQCECARTPQHWQSSLDRHAQTGRLSNNVSAKPVAMAGAAGGLLIRW
jgi:hypothetical protein